MTPHEDELRRLFQEVPVPDGVERWPERVPRSRRTPRVASGRLAPVLVASLTIVLLLGVVLVVGPRLPGIRTGSVVSDHTPSATVAASPSVPAAPTTSAAPSSPARTASSLHPSGSPAAGWPSPSTTGVPAGTHLTTHDGDLHLTVAGQTVTGLLVKGTVFVEAPNVMVRATRIVGGGYFGLRQLSAATNLVIEDSDVSGGVQYGIVQEATGLTVRRTHVHGVQQGIEAGSQASIVDSLIDDLSPSSSSTGVATRGGTGFTLRHSVVLNPSSAGTAVAAYADTGAQSGVLVEDCLLGGGKYTLHVGSGVSSVTVTGNRFSRSIWPRGGSEDAVRWDAAPPGIRWSDNAWQDTGLALLPPS